MSDVSALSAISLACIRLVAYSVSARNDDSKRSYSQFSDPLFPYHACWNQWSSVHSLRLSISRYFKIIVCRLVLDMEPSESDHTAQDETLAHSIFNRCVRDVLMLYPISAETSKERCDLLISLGVKRQGT